MLKQLEEVEVTKSWTVDREKEGWPTSSSQLMEHFPSNAAHCKRKKKKRYVHTVSGCPTKYLGCLEENIDSFCQLKTFTVFKNHFQINKWNERDWWPLRVKSSTKTFKQLSWVLVPLNINNMYDMSSYYSNTKIAQNKGCFMKKLINMLHIHNWAARISKCTFFFYFTLYF